MAWRFQTQARPSEASFRVQRFGLAPAMALALMTLAVTGCPPPPGEDECAQSSDCAAGERCVRFGEDAPTSCAAPCGVDNPCEAGRACIAILGLPSCIENTESRGLGEICVDDTQCESGACVNDANVSSCVSLCEDSLDCPLGERCHVDGVRKVCLAPLDDRRAGEQCENSRQCDSGHCVEFDPLLEAECVDPCDDGGCDDDTLCIELNVGTTACVPAIETGASCIQSTRCAGGLCIADFDGSRLCTSDCDAGCPQDWFCVSDADGAPICMPPIDNKARGEECTDTRECSSGLCIIYNDFDGNAFAQTCAVACDVGCNADEMCWPQDDAVDVCGPQL